MAQAHSFDIVSTVDLQEVKNAIAQATKEVVQRFDFKGSKASMTLVEKEHRIDLAAEDDMKMRNLGDILRTKLAKRQLPLKAFTFQDMETAGGGMVRQKVDLQNGIPIDRARDVVKLIKGSKIKVQASIQEDQVRVTGKSLDDLQAVMQMLKAQELDIDMQFINYR